MLLALFEEGAAEVCVGNAEELPEELVEEVDVDAVDVSAAELIIVVGSATAVAPIPLRTADVVCYRELWVSFNSINWLMINAQQV